MAEKPTLYVCHGDDRRGSRHELMEATGTEKLPTLKLPDGTVISHSRAILAWVRDQQERDEAWRRAA